MFTHHHSIIKNIFLTPPSQKSLLQPRDKEITESFTTFSLHQKFEKPTEVVDKVNEPTFTEFWKSSDTQSCVKIVNHAWT